MTTESQSSALVRLLKVAHQSAFRVWQLSFTLRTLSYLTLAGIVLAIVGMGYYNPEVVLMSGKFEIAGKSLQQSLTWGGLAMALATVLLTPILGKEIMRKMGIFRYRELVNRWAIGLGVGLVGWLAASLHLHVFDKLFLKYGRLSDDTKNSQSQPVKLL